MVILNIASLHFHIYKVGPKMELFKRYALQLVNSAIPSLKYNEDIMEEACECIPIMEQEDETHPITALLATMSIAKDYSKELELLQNTSPSDYSNIGDGLAKNIRKILAVLESPSKLSDATPIDKILRKYALKVNQNPSHVASGSKDNARDLRSVIDCYRSMISLTHEGSNRAFFDKLTTGFEIAGALVRDEFGGKQIDPESRDLLCDRIQQVRSTWLITLDYNYLQQKVQQFLDSLK